MDTFKTALTATLKHEGVYSDDSDDSGGKTKFGITEAVARGHGYSGEMRDLSVGVAKSIYRKSYWDRIRLDDVAKYDTDIAVKLFDIAVNMGTGRAGKFLQRAVNCMSRDQNLFPHLNVDGVVGTKTLDTLRRLYLDSEKPAILKIINVLQGAKYIGICENNNTQEKYIRGQLNRVT